MSDIRRFQLLRHRDSSGVSGVGLVAEGVCFSDGTAVVRWRGSLASTAVHDRMSNIEAIHGHHGSTEILWLD